MTIKTCFAKFWPHFEKQNSHHSRMFENQYVALKLEILQLPSSNWQKRLMARKASMIVILPSFIKQEESARERALCQLTECF